MNILKSERFRQAEEKEGLYFVLEPSFIKEALEGGVEFGSCQFFVYMYLRWCEVFGKYHVLFAGREHIAEYIGATEKEVDNALYHLSRKGLIQYIDFKVNILRAKQKFWVSKVRLSQIRHGLPSQEGGLPSQEGGLPSQEGGLPSQEGAALSVPPQSEDNKKDNKKDNIYVLEADFNEFWIEYPRKADKKKAYETYVKVRNDKKNPVTKEEILDGVKRYKKLIERQNIEKRYVKMAQGWLNGRRWEDEYDSLKPETPSGVNQSEEGVAAADWADAF